MEVGFSYSEHGNVKKIYISAMLLIRKNFFVYLTLQEDKIFLGGIVLRFIYSRFHPFGVESDLSFPSLSSSVARFSIIYEENKKGKLMMSERYFSKEFKAKTTERNAQSYYIVVVGKYSS